jgi:hypothetical protein
VNRGGGAQNLWWGKHEMRPAQRSSGGVVSLRGTGTRAHTRLTIRRRMRGSKAGGQRRAPRAETMAGQSTRAGKKKEEKQIEWGGQGSGMGCGQVPGGGAGEGSDRSATAGHGGGGRRSGGAAHVQDGIGEGAHGPMTSSFCLNSAASTAWRASSMAIGGGLAAHREAA